MNKLDVQNAILNAMTPYLDDDQLYQLKNTLEETRLSVGKRTKICVKKNENLCQKFCAATAEKRKKEWEKDILTVQPENWMPIIKKNYYSPLRTAKEECLQQRRSVQ